MEKNEDSDKTQFVDWALFFCLHIFLIGMYLSDDYWFGTNFFKFIMAPIALLPVGFRRVKFFSFSIFIPSSVSLSNPLYTLSMACSYISVFLFLFLLLTAMSTWIYPQPTFFWFKGILEISSIIFLFMFVVARLSIAIPDFYEIFILSISIIASVNGVINLAILSFDGLNLEGILANRFSPSFGHVPDHFVSNAALAYGLMFATSCIGFIMYQTAWRRVIFGLSSLVMIALLLLTQSRAPLLGILVGVTVILFINYKIFRPNIILIISFTMTVFYPIFQLGQYLHWRTLSHRESVWSAFFSLIQDRPIFGYGQRIELMVHIPSGEIVGHAHNMIMTAIIRGGVFSGIFLSMALCFSIFFSGRFYFYSKNMLPLIFSVILVVGGIFDYPIAIFQADWQWICYWLPFGLFIGAEKMYSRNNDKTWLQPRSVTDLFEPRKT